MLAKCRQGTPREVGSLLECLVNMNEAFRGQAAPFVPGQLALAVPLLRACMVEKDEHRGKEILLKVIDLVCSLAGIGGPALAAGMPGADLGRLLGLLEGPDSEVKQYVFSMVGNLIIHCRSLIEPFLGQILKASQNCLTRQPAALVNNCSLCLTEMLLAYGLSQHALELARKLF